MEQSSIETETFLNKFESLCLEHRFFLNGVLGEFKPQAICASPVPLPKASFRSFVAAYKKLCFESKLRITCLLENEGLIVTSMGPDLEIDEAHFEELLEAGPIWWRAGIFVELQMAELRFNTLKERSE